MLEKCLLTFKALKTVKQLFLKTIHVISAT